MNAAAGAAAMQSKRLRIYIICARFDLRDCRGASAADVTWRLFLKPFLLVLLRTVYAAIRYGSHSDPRTTRTVTQDSRFAQRVHSAAPPAGISHVVTLPLHPHDLDGWSILCFGALLEQLAYHPVEGLQVAKARLHHREQVLPLAGPLEGNTAPSQRQSWREPLALSRRASTTLMRSFAPPIWTKVKSSITHCSGREARHETNVRKAEVHAIRVRVYRGAARLGRRVAGGGDKSTWLRRAISRLNTTNDTVIPYGTGRTPTVISPSPTSRGWARLLIGCISAHCVASR